MSRYIGCNPDPTLNPRRKVRGPVTVEIKGFEVGATIVFQNRYEGCGACNQTARIHSAQSAVSAFGRPAARMPTPTPATPSSGFKVALQVNTGKLWTLGTAGSRSWALDMQAGTSPAITSVPGRYEVAFQTWNGKLVTAGNAGNKNWGLDLMAGTNPAVTAAPGGSEVAFQSHTGKLVTAGAAGNTSWGAGMKTATSPAIAS